MDTNVFIAALRSKSGASYRLLLLVGLGRFEVVMSVPLVLGYEAVANRMMAEIPIDGGGLEDLLSYLCGVADPVKIHFLWRPLLGDAKDDMVLELAVAGHCDCIVTHNGKDFEGGIRFGIEVISARNFLRSIGELS